jgi:hypothetical protein
MAKPKTAKGKGMGIGKYDEHKDDEHMDEERSWSRKS